MCSSIEIRPIQLNNDAASFVTKRDYASAIPLFAAALKSSQQAIVDTLDIHTPSHPSMANSTILDDCMIMSGTTQGSYDDNADDYMEEMYPNGLSGIFHKPIQIGHRIELLNNHEAPLTIATIVMFNLALANHLYAVENGAKNKDVFLLRKALRLYEHAYAMQFEQNESCLCGNALFSMATINNLGSIHRMLDENDVAQRCFQHLLSTLMFVIDIGDGPLVSQLCDDLFFRTTSFLIFTSKTTAAAA